MDAWNKRNAPAFASVVAHDGKLYAFYLGWTVLVHVPFSNFIGVAISDVKDGANNFKTLSSKLEVSLGDNMDGLTRQAKDSLQQFSAFMQEGRRTAVTLNRILEKLEADPKGFLLGGNQVPEYTPKGQ